MSTGHILPGYHDPVGRLRRIQNIGYPIETEKLSQIRHENSLDGNEFEIIRARAREIWSKPDREKTTYNFHYNGDRIGEFIESRPFSPTRRNKPHPPLVFLTNRLHHIDGFPQPDKSVHTQAYQVDGSVPYCEQEVRNLTRSKFIGRPSTTSVNQYRDVNALKEFLEPTPAQATTAWLSWATKEDKERALCMLDEERKEITRTDSTRVKTAVPSLHRWMKYSGPLEKNNLYGTCHRPPHPPGPLPPPVSMATFGLRQSRLQPQPQAKLRFLSARGDYSIHPDWPPTIPHHRVP